MNKPEEAFELYQKIIVSKSTETLRLLKLGQIFKQYRDEKLYQLCPEYCESFNEFCANPEIGYQRAYIYLLIGVYEKYIMELDIPLDVLAEIPYSRLKQMRQYIQNTPKGGEWLEGAMVLSDKDWINKIRKAKGKLPMPPSVSSQEHHGSSLLSTGGGKFYEEYVRSQPCINHPDRQSEYAHFPRTRGHGEFGIPLCHECHIGKQHQDGDDTFFALNKANIGVYLDKMIKNFRGG